MLHDLILRLVDWYNDALATGGYPLIALLMAIESSIVPLPSEFVIPPAAHLAHTGQLGVEHSGHRAGGHHRIVGGRQRHVLGGAARGTFRSYYATGNIC